MCQIQSFHPLPSRFAADRESPQADGVPASCCQSYTQCDPGQVQWPENFVLLDGQQQRVPSLSEIRSTHFRVQRSSARSSRRVRANSIPESGLHLSRGALANIESVLVREHRPRLGCWVGAFCARLGDGLAEKMSSKCCVDDSALLSAVPLHQRRLLQ